MILDVLQRLRSREKIWLGVMAVVLLLLLADWAVVQPVGRVYQDLDREIAQARTAVEYNHGVLPAESSVTEAFEAVGQKVGRVRSQAEDIDSMKGEIDSLAKKHAVTILAMKHRQPRNAPYYDEYFVEIGEFEADIANLLTFLHSLRASPGTLRISSLSLTPISGGSRAKGSMVISKVMMTDAKEASGS